MGENENAISRAVGKKKAKKYHTLGKLETKIMEEKQGNLKREYRRKYNNGKV